MARLYVAGYLMGSTNPKANSPDAQRQAIETHCQRVGLKLDGVYSDPAISISLPIHRRVAGARLDGDLRRGDHVVARFDQLAGTLTEATAVLDLWSRRGIVTHLLDAKGIRLDPDHPPTLRLIELLVAFAQAGRRMTGARAREQIAELKKQGKRYARHAPFGFEWQECRDGTNLVPNEAEQMILHRVGELWLQGYTIDAIRQYLAYTWKVKNRNNREFGCSEVRRMAIRGAREMAQERAASQP
jgi:DNA invertase Pin-like site-specific DNA recombinase